VRTHPNVPPRLPPLPFTDHTEEMIWVSGGYGYGYVQKYPGVTRAVR
jgi:hypothetical protein